MPHTSRKNEQFAKYGHECQMENELDELPRYIPGNSCCAKLKRSIMRFIMVSETNKRCNYYMRSQGAIAYEKHRHLQGYVYMVHPFSKARKIFEIFMCFVFLIQFVIIPLDVAYFRQHRKSIFCCLWFRWIRMILDIPCFLDVLANFITGVYVEHGKYAELSPKKVALLYLSSSFAFDFVSSIPTHIELVIDIKNQSVIKSLQLISLLKLMRYMTFMKYCKHIEKTYEIPYSLYKIVMISIVSLLFYHTLACYILLYKVYYMGYLYEDDSYKTRLTYELSYRRALYKMLLVALASKLPDRSIDIQEFIIIIIMWIISKILFILTIGTLSVALICSHRTIVGKVMQILRAATSSRQKYIEVVRQLKQYMSHRQLPEHMQKRLLMYYEFRYQKSYFRESEILSTISGQLRQEIVMHSCRKLVENVAFFDNIPFTLLVRIVSCLRAEVFLINDVIVKAGTPGNSMFFIASGTVTVYTASGREVCHLEDGAHFGEIALVMRDELRVASVVAIDVCELYRLDRKDFVRAIHPYPDLLDNIQRIAAERMETTIMLNENDRREIISKRLY